MENKVLKIAKELEIWQESEKDEEGELKRIITDKRGMLNKFKFVPVDKKSIEKILAKVPRKTSCGDDEIAYSDLKDAGCYAVDMIWRVTNMIIITSHWPSSWRNSIIKPLFKAGADRLDPTGYRPVALTSAVGRVVERVLNAQIVQYLQEEHLLLEECHGFVEGRGCSTALMEILQELIAGIEEGIIPTLLGVDISSAFNCIDRPKLQRQLRWMGFGEDALGLMESYFVLRTQQVEIGGKRSDKREAPIGVLQGSGLSPVLFLIYFLRGCYSVRRCDKCENEVTLLPRERRARCDECGASITYADDLNTIHRAAGGSRREVESKIEEQGTKIDCP